jgi:hypothetical protein
MLDEKNPASAGNFPGCAGNIPMHAGKNSSATWTFSDT